jgi:glucan phosphoethanolaminetransferase (alkaline phosphatase superfamily)
MERIKTVSSIMAIIALFVIAVIISILTSQGLIRVLGIVAAIISFVLGFYQIKTDRDIKQSIAQNTDDINTLKSEHSTVEDETLHLAR